MLFKCHVGCRRSTRTSTHKLPRLRNSLLCAQPAPRCSAPSRRSASRAPCQPTRRGAAEPVARGTFRWKIPGCLLTCLLHITNSRCCLLLLCSAAWLHAPELSTENMSSCLTVSPRPGTRVHFILSLRGVSLDEPLSANQMERSWACKRWGLWVPELRRSKACFALWWPGGLFSSPPLLKWTFSS